MLGDGGYACTNYLLTPLLNPRTDAELAYNKTQILMRNAIERLFGVLKRRFPALSTGLQIKLPTVLSLIVAVAVLHNVAIENRDDGGDFDDVAEVEPAENLEFNTEADEAHLNPNSGRMNLTRLNIINTFFT